MTPRVDIKQLSQHNLQTIFASDHSDTYRSLCHLKSSYGNFSNFAEYNSTVNLLIASTSETQHRDSYLHKEILPRLHNHDSMLDIGIGSGDLTMKIAQRFTNLTIVDIHQSALDAIPDKHGRWNTSVNKILQPVETVDLSGQAYDLIVFSHTIYYVEPAMRASIINKLYNALNPMGSLLIIYNTGGTRGEMVSFFGGSNFEFDSIYSSQFQFDTVLHRRMQEEIKVNDLCSMLKVCGLCLKDGGVAVQQESLESYVETNLLLGESIYAMTMVQNILLITHDNL